MKKLVILAAFLPGVAYAGDEPFDCNHNHHDGEMHCSVKAESVTVRSVSINGGECAAPTQHEIFNKTYYKGQKFTVPGTRECFYVRSIAITTGSGKTQHMHAL
jgi:hypothetical protein